MPKSRLSINIHGQAISSGQESHLMEWLQELDPTSVLVMDNEALARRILRTFPQCIVIHRNYGVTKGDDDVYRRVSPQQWMDLRAKEADTGLYLYTTNEPGFDRDVITWHVALMEEAVKRNVRLVVGNWSVGTPQAEAWGIARRLLDAINAHPDQFILGLHEYGAGVMTSGLYGGYPDNAGVQPGTPGGYNLVPPENWPKDASKITRFHCGRFKFLLQYCEQAGIRPPRIIVTEHGMDDMSDIGGWLSKLKVKQGYPNIRGYKTLEPQWADWYGRLGWSMERAYFEQLKWADKVIYQGSPVIGQLIYCYGHVDAKWEQFDIQYAAELQALLADYADTMKPAPAPIPTPQPAPIPTPVPVPTPAPEKLYDFTLTFGGLPKELADTLSKHLTIELKEKK